MYGKLGLIKTYGESPTFVILDKEGKVIATVDPKDWLLKRLGKVIDLFAGDTTWMLTDETYKE